MNNEKQIRKFDQQSRRRIQWTSCTEDALRAVILEVEDERGKGD
jgi:calcineurin-like phosphoesterase